MRGSLTVAITGASGAIYGIRFLEVVLQKRLRVNLIISKWGFEVIREECGIDLHKNFPESIYKRFGSRYLRLFDDQDLTSPLSSGSSGGRRMVIIPCSMGTIGRIASGISTTLIERSADVVLKEGGKLIVVPRETPLNIIHLENLLRLARAGAHIIPAMPGFYHKPKEVEDLVNFVVGKVLDVLSIEHNLFAPWRDNSF